MLANAMRGLAAEFGITVAKGMDKLEELITLVDTDQTIPKSARQAVGELHSHCGVATARIAKLEAQIVGKRQLMTAYRNDSARGILQSAC
jgi:hypothetical protein